MMNTWNPKFTQALLLTLFGILGRSSLVFGQSPEITVQFANPQFDCNTVQYCVDVEFKSNSANNQIFGMNVRLFYDDSLFEFHSFSGFHTGYGPVVPNPPLIATSGPAGPALFGFTGGAEFLNGAIQLVNANAPPLYLNSEDWKRIFKICFTVDAELDEENFCPPIVWDLESDPSQGGFLPGDDGVVITIVDPAPNVDSAPTDELVIQYNWEYNEGNPPPYGGPVEDSCLSINCTLPLTLLSFSGTTTELGNHLEWHTTSEINNSGFEIQKSVNGIQWENLGFVKAIQAAEENGYYSFIDSNPHTGKNLYRLRQVDLDGRYKFSSILILSKSKGDHAKDLLVYPNPVSEGILSIRLLSEDHTGGEIQLFNSFGILLYEAIMEGKTMELRVSDLPSGFYLVRLSHDNNEKIYRKIIVENE